MVSEIKFPIRTRIRTYYLSFYGDAMLPIYTEFLKLELDILHRSHDEILKEAVCFIMLMRLQFIIDWIMDDDWDIFLREDHT